MDPVDLSKELQGPFFGDVGSFSGKVIPLIFPPFF